ncbi:ABC-type microcin C transport system duplicated ATPase subunit YejF [Methylohalomonas lacus]|uniref:ABC-type microcin C transport system duplicated ATPase subunit YejF n=1 Tax=Methylohalomonas lacus TaxID=398773 RepID=A0AAE3HJP8_9GAMM|nr:ABC transporter ATP-binding protein [Methylohalomonas lacus]MCS3903005.1 ABC-type microcin C transport system duplicated ATPase subunit YejF [Methylohalomonas lacus]
MSHKLLEVRNLQTFFGDDDNLTRAVDDVSFGIDRDETLALLGESGSGKSITAHTIMRLLPPAARVAGGEVILDGQNLLKLPERRMRDIRGGRIAMIFQEPQSSLNPVLTAGQQIGETLARHQQLHGSAQRRRTLELLDEVGIPEARSRIDDYPHQFSGGMKQRIMIAMALAGRPDLLIADEPTTALDVTIQARILDLLKSLQRETHMGILFITHDIGVAAQVADHVAVMRHGCIVESNPREAFFARPRHPYTHELFDALPSRERRQREANDTRPDVASAPLLEVRDLKVHFPIRKGVFKRVVGHVRAVDGVSIRIHSGETVAMVGESGSGKTTLGKGILQLLKPTDGAVLFDGDELTRLRGDALRRRRADIQVVFQDPYASMNPRMLVGDIIEEGMLAQRVGGDRHERQARIEQLLQQVGLQAQHKNRYPHEFSGGQRQRICIARALAVDPKLIICDEPTSALDVSVQAQILDLLKDLQARLGLAYLFITHNIAVVEYLAHYVAVMYEGRVVEQGKVDDVLLQPQHEYTRKLLSAVPRPPEREAS